MNGRNIAPVDASFLDDMPAIVPVWVELRNGAPVVALYNICGTVTYLAPEQARRFVADLAARVEVASQKIDHLGTDIQPHKVRLL